VAGFITQPTVAKIRTDPKFVAAASGLTTGLAVGCLLAVALGRRGRRTMGRRQVPDGLGLPVLARMQRHDLRPADPAAATRRGGRASLAGAVEIAVQVHDFGGCLVAPEKDETLVDIAIGLNGLPAIRRGSPQRCVIVTRPQTRSGLIRTAAARAAASGQLAIGVILVEESIKRRWPRSALPKVDDGYSSMNNERNLGVKNSS
jgi:hypothetical protein